jgi:hypothetical protein
MEDVGLPFDMVLFLLQKTTLPQASLLILAKSLATMFITLLSKLSLFKHSSANASLYSVPLAPPKIRLTTLPKLLPFQPFENTIPISWVYAFSGFIMLRLPPNSNVHRSLCLPLQT